MTKIHISITNHELITNNPLITTRKYLETIGIKLKQLSPSEKAYLELPLKHVQQQPNYLPFHPWLMPTQKRMVYKDLVTGKIVNNVTCSRFARRSLIIY